MARPEANDEAVSRNAAIDGLRFTRGMSKSYEDDNHPLRSALVGHILVRTRAVMCDLYNAFELLGCKPRDATCTIAQVQAAAITTYGRPGSCYRPRQ